MLSCKRNLARACCRLSSVSHFRSSLCASRRLTPPRLIRHRLVPDCGRDKGGSSGRRPLLSRSGSETAALRNDWRMWGLHGRPSTSKGACDVAAIFEGKDPAHERRERRQEPTWGELTALYLERHGPRKRTAGNDRNMLNRYFEAWQHRRLSNLTRKDVTLLHQRIGETAPYAANRVVALVRKMFNLAQIWRRDVPGAQARSLRAATGVTKVFRRAE